MAEKKILMRNLMNGGNHVWILERFANDPQWCKRMKLERVEQPEVANLSPQPPPEADTVEKKADWVGDKFDSPAHVLEADNKPETPNLEELNVKELKELADEAGIKYARNAGKKKMIELLTK